RPGIRLDWDRNGYVQPGKIEWVSWAGHCDIKAIMESLGLTLRDKPSLYEYRSDTGGIHHYNTDHLLEMLASAMELGSIYQQVDDNALIQRGVHRFGGFRNDSRPDRLQFTGLSKGRHFRWPLSGRQGSFTVLSIEDNEASVDMNTAFFRHIPDVAEVDFTSNPRFLKTVEGDYNLIDVAGTRLKVRVILDEFDPQSGYPSQKTEELDIDMRESSEAVRVLLGTHIKDAAAREVYRVYLDIEDRMIVAELLRWSYNEEDGHYSPETLPDEEIQIPLAKPFGVTLSREMKRDNPESFQSLLTVALRTGQSICTDTDMQAEVWNGVVTGIHAAKLNENADARTEHWQIRVAARFGRAHLDYLLRRDTSGIPEAWCPAVGESHWGKSIDFLWQDFPDVASKGVEQGEWVVNQTMLKRNIVNFTHLSEEEGGFFVEDEHIKCMYEQIFAALSGHTWTIIHNNKRYGFTDQGAWKASVRRLDGLRERLAFGGPEAQMPWPAAIREADVEERTLDSQTPNTEEASAPESEDAEAEAGAGSDTEATTETDTPNTSTTDEVASDESNDDLTAPDESAIDADTSESATTDETAATTEPEGGSSDDSTAEATESSDEA
ncbi:MAG: hypothetical protein ACPG77_09530, partial [Nannocystaceae bacterium]